VKAICLVEAGKPLQLREVPLPEMSDTDVLVRVRAAGICHSDVHYRAGRSTMGPLPLALGHEVAGVVEQAGSKVSHVKVGERVCLHYNISCGHCFDCLAGNEQFCETVKMIGHHVHGGYSEFIVVPGRNAVHLPDEISFEEGATLMCASATALHALYKSRIKTGETVAVFGIGGLGFSAVQIAKVLGASLVLAVDISQDKLDLASDCGAIPIDAGLDHVVEDIRKATGGRGVDVALELIGLPRTITEAIDCLAVLGRAVIVGLTQKPITLNTYRQVLANEAEIIGSNDHLLSELPVLLDMARNKSLDTSRVVSRTIPLDADKINERLDQLENYTTDVRVVVVP
jgi:2-desacetyl-2-hydroxyethyl bacteriochlorophyllide A dehydrogenase